LSNIAKAGIGKRNSVIKWLKNENNFGHMHANLLMGIYANDGKPVYSSEQNLFEQSI
jgi:hypothetical protein